MKINVTMTKDKANHKSFLVFIPQYAVETVEKVLEEMEKTTGVPWNVNLNKTDSRFLAVETGDMTAYWRRKQFAEGLDEKCYVNWRMEWKNKVFEIDLGNEVVEEKPKKESKPKKPRKKRTKKEE